MCTLASSDDDDSVLEVSSGGINTVSGDGVIIPWGVKIKVIEEKRREN